MASARSLSQEQTLNASRKLKPAGQGISGIGSRNFHTYLIRVCVTSRWLLSTIGCDHSGLASRLAHTVSRLNHTHQAVRAGIAGCLLILRGYLRRGASNRAATVRERFCC